MKATVGEHLSIQVTELQHRALEHTTTAVIYTGLAFGKINVAAARGVGAQVVFKAIGNAIAKGGARAAARAGAAGAAADGAAEAGAEVIFQLGYRAALSGTAIGIVAGVAVAAKDHFLQELYTSCTVRKSLIKYHNMNLNGVLSKRLSNLQAQFLVE